jgi:hypothetical protein
MTVTLAATSVGGEREDDSKELYHRLWQETERKGKKARVAMGIHIKQRCIQKSDPEQRHLLDSL